MSKIEAYKCDCCQAIKPAEQIQGVRAIESLYNVLESFPIEAKDLNNCPVHFCVECYTRNVIEAAGRICSRKNDEEKYQNIIKELSYTLRKTLILKVLRPDLKTKKKTR